MMVVLNQINWFGYINVEMTRWIKSIKYVYKYITKGSDKEVFGLEKTNDIDGLKIYAFDRYISSLEAV